MHTHRLSRGIALWLISACGCAALLAAPSLKVSADGRFLQRADGSPFFYLGDTAWELFHRLTREEADRYLTNRTAKGFTVIQAVALAEFDGLKTPNAYGHLPLQDLDPARPNETYFQHVDWVVNRAGELGLFIGMLPTWGDKFNQRWGVGPEVFNPTNAQVYGEFLGRRYRDKPILWILGGDRSPENEAHFAIIRALAAGLRKGDGGNHLMTYHPMGGDNSAKWFHRDDWLSLNMFQSGHGAPNTPNDETTAANYALTPAKPTLDGEPRYEDHPIDWKPEKGWFEAFDVRQAAYWSLLAGACGHTYGNHNIWQFWQRDRAPISAARTVWTGALDQPGAFQMAHVRRLFESRPYQKLRPDQTLLVGDPGSGAGHMRAARAVDGSFAFIYTPLGKPVTVKLDVLSGSTAKASWFDPRTGVATAMETVPIEGLKEFAPPSNGRGNDWVLVLDDAAQDFPLPGATAKSEKR